MECPPTPPSLPEGGIPSPEPVKMMKMEDTALPRSGSPEPNCTICLGPLTDKSNTDICAHKFCYNCILTWSKVKSECPLCKQKFSMIYHDFKEDGSHAVYTVPRPIPDPMESELHGNYYMVVNMPNLEMPILPVPPFMRRNLNRHRLPHNPTAFSRFRRSIPRPMALSAANDNLPPARGTRSQSRLLEAITFRPDNEGPVASGIERRRQIYALNQWALPLPDLTGRTREYSLQFFTANPAVTHRLTAWILRDLSVLLSETRIFEASQRINELLMQQDLRSPEFTNEVRRFLGDRTRHFMHELISYARSPYDMIGYDRSASYGNWDPTLESYLQNSHAADGAGTVNDEDIVEVHVERAPRLVYPEMRERLNFYRQRDTDRWGRIYARIRSIQDYSARAGELLNFPMPSPSSAFTAFTAAAPVPLPNPIMPPSVTVQAVAGPSGLAPVQSSPPEAIVLDSSEDEMPAPVPSSCPPAVTSDNDEVEVVGIYKSRNQRTPELIELNSDAEAEETVQNSILELEDTPLDLHNTDNLDVVSFDLLMDREETPPQWDGREEEVPSSSASLDKKRKRHRDSSPSPSRSKHKKHKKKKKSKHESKNRKSSSHKNFFYGVLSSDEEENPLEYVPPKIKPDTFSSSDDDDSLPRIKSVVVSSWGNSCNPSTSQSYS